MTRDHIAAVRRPGVLIRATRAFLSDGNELRRIYFGLLRGISYELDLRQHIQIYFGLFESELKPWFRAFVRGIRTAVDIGAGDGRYTLPLLAHRSIERIIAVEPTPRAERLLRNARANGLDGDRLELRRELVQDREVEGIPRWTYSPVMPHCRSSSRWT